MTKKQLFKDNLINISLWFQASTVLLQLKIGILGGNWKFGFGWFFSGGTWKFPVYIEVNEYES